MSDDVIVPEETQQLVRLLVNETKARRLEWTKGSSSTEFVLVRREGSIVITSRDDDGQYPFVLRVLDPEGVAVEEYSTAEDLPAVMDNDIASLYNAARRSEVKASPVVKDLVETLKAEQPKADDIPF